MRQPLKPKVPTDDFRKFKIRRKLNFEEIPQRLKIRLDLPEIQRRNLPDIKLTNLEYEVLIGIVQGRTKTEISTGLKLLGAEKSYNQILAIIIKKFDALTLPNAIYKAFKMGILD